MQGIAPAGKSKKGNTRYDISLFHFSPEYFKAVGDSHLTKSVQGPHGYLVLFCNSEISLICLWLHERCFCPLLLPQGAPTSDRKIYTPINMASGFVFRVSLPPLRINSLCTPFVQIMDLWKSYAHHFVKRHWCAGDKPHSRFTQHRNGLLCRVGVPSVLRSEQHDSLSH